MLTILMFATLQAAPATDLRPGLGWMSGYWLSCEDGRETSEVWTDPRLGLIAGLNVTVRGDRVGWEASRIAAVYTSSEAPFAYHAQPGGLPETVFPVIASSANRVVFEQARDDDFPKRIVYQRDGDILLARIEGVVDGEEQSVQWRFHKAELNSRCTI